MSSDFWLNLYCDDDNPHYLRTKHLSEEFQGWDWIDMPLSCFNDFCNMFLYKKEHLGRLKKYDQQIFKYYVKKMREYRNAGNVIDEDDENYLNFINYFKTYV